MEHKAQMQKTNQVVDIMYIFHSTTPGRKNNLFGVWVHLKVHHNPGLSLPIPLAGHLSICCLQQVALCCLDETCSKSMHAAPLVCIPEGCIFSLACSCPLVCGWSLVPSCLLDLGCSLVIGCLPILSSSLAPDCSLVLGCSWTGCMLLQNLPPVRQAQYRIKLVQELLEKLIKASRFPVWKPTVQIVSLSHWCSSFSRYCWRCFPSITIKLVLVWLF